MRSGIMLRTYLVVEWLLCVGLLAIFEWLVLRDIFDADIVVNMENKRMNNATMLHYVSA